MSEDHVDYWEQKGQYWFRHHIRPGSTLYIPHQTAGAPDPEMLSSIRETRFRYCQPAQGGVIDSQAIIRFDDWRKIDHYESAAEFTGITIFRQLGQYPDQLTDHEPSAESAGAMGLRAPN